MYQFGVVYTDLLTWLKRPLCSSLHPPGPMIPRTSLDWFILTYYLGSQHHGLSGIYCPVTMIPSTSLEWFTLICFHDSQHQFGVVYTDLLPWSVWVIYTVLLLWFPAPVWSGVNWSVTMTLSTSFVQFILTWFHDSKHKFGICNTAAACSALADAVTDVWIHACHLT